MKKLFALSLIALVAFSSCSKDDDKETPNPSGPQVVLAEDFASATKGTVDNAGGDLWVGNVNFPAESIAMAYEAAGMVKIASSKAAGYLETKTLDLSANNGAVTIKFKVKGWYADAKMIVSMGEETQTIDIKADKAATTLEEKEVKFTKGTKTSKIKFATGTVIFNGAEQISRFFIDDIQVIN